MILLYEMISGSESYEMSVVGGGRYRYTPGTSDVCMTHLISEYLQLISQESVIIPQHMIM